MPIVKIVAATNINGMTQMLVASTADRVGYSVSNQLNNQPLTFAANHNRYLAKYKRLDDIAGRLIVNSQPFSLSLHTSFRHPRSDAAMQHARCRLEQYTVCSDKHEMMYPNNDRHA